MKKITIIVSSLLLLVSTAAFSFQEKEDTGKKLDFGVKLGASLSQDGIISRSEGYSDNRITIGANLRYWFAGNFGIGAEIHFERYSITHVDEVNSEFQQTKTKVPISFNGYYRMSDSEGVLMPYLGGGLSVIYIDNNFTRNGSDMIEMPVNDPEAVLGFNVVAGFEYKSFFVETQYIWAEANTLKEISYALEETNVGSLNLWFGFRF